MPQTLESMERALQLAPRDANTIGEYGVTFVLLRRYAEADVQLKRALAMDADVTNAKDFLLMSRLFGAGDLAGARAAFEPPPSWRIASNTIIGGDVIYLINPRVYAKVFDRQFDAALRDWDSAPIGSEDDSLSQRVARVAIKLIADDPKSVQPQCKELKSLLDTQLARNPDSMALLQQASWVDVCLGLNADAIAAARRAADLLPISKDHYYGVYQAEGLAEIEARAGAPDDALNLIEELLQIPAGQSMTIERLKRDPLWDPLRKDPRFDELLRHHAADRSSP